MNVRRRYPLALILAISLAGCARRQDMAPADAPVAGKDDARQDERKQEHDAELEVAQERAPAPEMARRIERTAKLQSGDKLRANGPVTAPAPPPVAATVPGVLGGTLGNASFSTGSFAELPVDAQGQPFDTESYAHAAESAFLRPTESPLSTFSIDVDTASYANVRRFLEGGSLPPADAVRIEELLNNFRYDDPAPSGRHPFSVTAEIADAPWSPGNRLLRIGLRGQRIAHADLPARNLVFLVDVSGSMQSANKLPLVKDGLRLLVKQLDGFDRVSMVVYAGAAGVVLEPTRGDDHATILDAIDRLEAGGSTNGAQGILRAYELAEASFIEGGANRVVLCSDGDFNVGTTSEGELVRLIEKEREKGVFLTVLGFGMGNLKDSMMEKVADHGNGNYAYIDSIDEARKVLVSEADATLVTIAKDVKIQVEFNPAQVEAYRLIGYDNRRLADEDFNDDRKDAGEIGAGHSVTALYEIVPRGGSVERPAVDPLKYQTPRRAATTESGELATIKLRYKQPDGESSQLLQTTVVDGGTSLRRASEDLRFAAAVATFGLVLRESEHRGDATLELARELATTSIGKDEGGHRAGFLRLVDRARELKGDPVATTMTTTR